MTRDPMALLGLALMLIALGTLSFEAAVLVTLAAALVLVDDETEDALDGGAGVDRC
ncbi:hypothetical protein SUDANB121_05896 (plasmid) [Nocardiopsis dassonvillei]|uniref:hypothetical protein n=1 Tax=Nocardiopsis dassonvillei TaxID=2014 RepID=UPI003F54A261